MGKSRLCTELFGHIEGRPGLVRWRQGRCLPYGEGIALWALGEIVKAEAGILESDSPGEAAVKLEGVLPADAPDLPWLRARLLPLVGAGGEPASQEESFTAWRRVLESWAAERETVLVFEDLHWADEALLSFLEHLADWAEGVPLLVLCTARPELYEQHPGFGAGARNAHRINLAPLSDEETAVLVSSLLERAVLPAETQQALLERAGGNPLYAEEFVRLLADRGELAGAGEVPDSVQALIAARLDTLSAERKRLLQDASVLGKVFWAGALCEMGGRDPQEVTQSLHELSRKELVRPARQSSMAGEAEYGFWHLLVRDVAYGQIPRAARADKHRSAAAWIEQKAGERAEDLADVLAYHYLTALELAQAAGDTDQAAELAAPSRRYLVLAGERALGLDTAQAEARLARALELTPADDPQHADLLVRWAEAAHQAGRPREAAEALEQALTGARARGDTETQARALIQLSPVADKLGEGRQLASPTRRSACSSRLSRARPSSPPTRSSPAPSTWPAPTRRRSPPPSRPCRWRSGWGWRCRPGRSASAASPAPTSAMQTGWPRRSGRSPCWSSRGRAGPPPSSRTTSPSPATRSRARPARSRPSKRGSPSANSAAWPRASRTRGQLPRSAGRARPH